MFAFGWVTLKRLLIIKVVINILSDHYIIHSEKGRQQLFRIKQTIVFAIPSEVRSLKAIFAFFIIYSLLANGDGFDLPGCRARS